MSFDLHSKGAGFNRQIMSDVEDLVRRMIGGISATVGAQKDGTGVSDRHRVLNFQGPGVTVSDEPSLRRINVFVPGALSTGSTITVSSSVATVRARTLWNGTSNDVPPANWQTTAYVDTGSPWINSAGSGGARWSSASPLSATEQALFRCHFTLPAGQIASATLYVAANDASNGAYVGGTLIPGTVVDPANSGVTVPLDVTLLTAGGADNVLAIWGRNTLQVGALDAWIAFTVTVTMNVAAVDPQYIPKSIIAAKGDLIAGASAAAPAAVAVGTNGQVLTADSTAADGVSWQTPAGGGMSNPMTTQDDIIVGGTAGAATRLAKGSDGDLLSVDAATHHVAWKAPGTSTLSTATSTLGSDVTLGSAGVYSDGPSVSLAAGTWFVTTTATMRNTSGTGTIFDVKLWNGTTVYASTGSIANSGTQDYSYTCSAIITLGSTTTVKVSAAAANNSAGKIAAACTDNGAPGSATQINALKVA